MSSLKLLICLLLLLSLGCTKPTSKNDAAHDKPATVEKLPVETELAKVTLSVDADRRLGIKTAAVVMQSVAPRRTFGGDAIVPNGNTIVVTAPVSGIVTQSAKRSLPLPGERVQSGEAVVTLVPLLSPERDVPTPAEQVQLVGARANLVAAQTVAMGDIERSRAEVEGAKIALDRAKQLFADRAGARRAVDDAEAQLNIATSVFDAATERQKQLAGLLTKLEMPKNSGEAISLPMTTPIAGIINRLNVSEGQTVANGAPLFEVIQLDTIWIRVPVFVDLLPKIEDEQAARLVSLSGIANATAAIAKPITAPPTADALSSSADLYYEVDNRDLGLRPGQRVGVELAMKGSGEALAVPASSILYDVNGGTWVYEVKGERQYQRHRVAIRWSDGETAILESGPSVGTQVVVEGAAELFGTEFGTGK